MELIRLLAIGALLIVLHGGTCASAQMTCSVAHTESKGLEGNSGRNLLTGLIEERLSLMTGVARAKWNNGSAIEDPVREQQLLTDVGVKAQALGLSAEWAQHFSDCKSRPLKRSNIASSPNGPLRHKNHFQKSRIYGPRYGHSLTG